MVENSTNTQSVSDLLRNLSFEGGGSNLSYHEKYYYPRLACQRMLNMEQRVGEPKITAGHRSQQSTATTAATYSSGKQNAPLMDRSESLQSNESNFSEDYTRMTDGESVDWEERTPAESSSWSSDDFSDRASVTTLDNEEEPANEPSHNNRVNGTDEDDPDVFVNLALLKKLNLDGAGGDMKTEKVSRAHSAGLKLDTSRIVITPPDDSPAESADNTMHFCNSEEGSGGGGGGSGRADDDGDEPKPHMEHSDSSSFYEDREFDFLKLERVKRSTSLKTNKTPPGTPSRKKAVRFADALGLDLESVRHILSLDSPPKIPASAMHDLQTGLREQHKETGNKYLSACFIQPGGQPDFYQQVRANNVRLENCLVDDKTMTVTGSVKVANIAYHKAVTVRYSVNGWVSHEDICASYVQNSNDGPTDRFSFTINVPYYFNVGSRLEFCIFFTAGGKTYWDSNGGKNYAVECFAQAVPVSANDTSWMHFL